MAESEEGVDDRLVVDEVLTPQGVAIIIAVQDAVDDHPADFVGVHGSEILAENSAVALKKRCVSMALYGGRAGGHLRNPSTGLSLAPASP